MARAARIVWSVVFLVAGVVTLCLGLLSADQLSKCILSLSYDNEVEHLGLLVGVARGGLAVLGVLLALHGIPSVRREWSNRILPLPPPTAHDVSWPPPNSFVASAAMALFLGLMNLPVLVALATKSPWLSKLLREDGIYENLQALMFFLGSAAMAWATYLYAKRVKPVGLVHGLWVCFSLLLLFACLEETSYGQRALHFATPKAWTNMNQQNEFNLHNVATGLTNRLFALGAISIGVFVPAACFLSRRTTYLFSRLRLPVPSWPAFFAFAAGAMYTTPRRFCAARFDEQRFLCYAVLAVIGWLLLVSIRRRDAKWTTPLGLLLSLLIIVRGVEMRFTENWPVGNYSEEVKEWFIAFGLFWYAVSLVRAGRAAGTNPGQPAAEGTQ